MFLAASDVEAVMGRAVQLLHACRGREVESRAEAWGVTFFLIPRQESARRKRCLGWISGSA